eukprot:GDKK01021572.1.p1 GENE.GDKK01021572.1~~GDKK01021572.1.p1  ORF type:complete len:107 (+),score=6.20 GDKK01021572.1:45-365(+)
MHNSKSYMVPKMIFANVLAVIMMTFEGHAPAEINEKPQKVIGDQHSRTGSVQADGLMKVADTSQNEAIETPVEKKPAVAKKTYAQYPSRKRKNTSHTVGEGKISTG